MAIASFLAKVPPPPTPGRPRVRRGGRRKLSPLDVAVDDAQRRSASGDWGEGTKGATLVGLYAFCHRLTYGIVPDELQEQRLFYAAAKRAAVRSSSSRYSSSIGAPSTASNWRSVAGE